MITTAELRQKFLDFFHSKGHTIVASSSLVPPQDDKTLLFTNAGMNQFKDVFLGFDKRDYSRATTAQKCVRAGGKHNDLENVGYTARHHTFFEMLGNFSFGDYFKHDALHLAWEFLTSPQWLNLPAEKLLATVYADDDEAYRIWQEEIGLPADRIIRIGDNKGAKYASDNFWQMGDTGPCGPCSEIFYDHGAHIWGGPPGSAEEDGDRFIEIWNCVFMQFNRDEAGVMQPLPKPSVDTGMGLERVTAVLQNVHSNYEIDLFQHLIAAAARVTGAKLDLNTPSLKVIADHIRSCAFLIADGVLPSNEGRGYVLRRIIRRAVRHGYQLGCKELFFHKLVPDLVKEMGAAYPELIEKQTQITESLRHEEARFAQTLETGMALLEDALKDHNAVLDGAVIFKLYDTYGFPYDLTADICRERGITPDEEGFEREMAVQRARARAHQQFKAAAQIDYNGATTPFTGYENTANEATIIALYQNGVAVDTLLEGEEGLVVLTPTPFYAESGGQIGDRGVLIGASQQRFEVTDTQKIKAAVHASEGVMLSGSLKVGDKVSAQIDENTRRAIMRNHSATHLMHAALRQVLGTHVEQKGSLVTVERTRFDFSHPQPVRSEELRHIEALVNQQILANIDVQAQIMPMDEAKKSGAMMLFNEKYGDEVRVLRMGKFSTELCGGTHVARTGDIGLFRFVSESGIAAGIRRVEAVTGEAALAAMQHDMRLIDALMHETKAQTADVIMDKIHALQAHNKALEKSLGEAESKIAAASAEQLLAHAVSLGDVRYISAQLSTNAAALRDIATALVAKANNLVVLLAAINDDKVALCAAVSKALTQRLRAGDLVKQAAEQIGGKGGGRPDLAQAGGSQPENIDKALAVTQNWISENA